MKTRLLLLVLLCLGFFSSYAQEALVIDKVNLKPIQNVAVFTLDQKVSAISDSKGMVDFSKFPKDAHLTFQHTSYQELILSYNDVKDNGFRVELAPSNINLDEVVISANKWEQKREDVPNKIAKIKLKEIQFDNPQTSADLLGASGQVFIQKSQMGGGSPMIRGFAANGVLLVYDGIRMNNVIFRGGNLQNVILIDPNALQSAEVIYGPGSVVYGSDALGGVMNFRSSDIVFSNTEDKLIVKGGAMLRTSTANGEKTGHISLNLAGKRWGSYTSFTLGDFGDLRQGSNGNSYYDRPYYASTIDGKDTVLRNSDVDVQRPSAYSQKNFMQKLKYKLSDKAVLGYQFLYTTSSNVPRYDRLTQLKSDDSSPDELKYAEWYYGPQNWILHALTLDMKDAFGFFDQMRATVAYQNYEESRNKRKFNKSVLTMNDEDVDAYSLNLDFQKKIAKSLTAYAGIEGVSNIASSVGVNKDINTGETSKTESRYPDGGTDYYSAAIYANAVYEISPSFTLNSGIRYSVSSLDTKFDDYALFEEIPFETVPALKQITLNNQAINGSLGLVYHPNRTTNVHLNLGSGFRAPNLDDVGKFFESVDYSIVVPNPDLKPEYAYNLDLGFVKSFAGKFRINADAFYTYLVDAMVRRPYHLGDKEYIEEDGELLQVLAIQNAGHANIYGFSGGLYYDVLPFMNIYSNITYTKGEDNDGNALDHVAPLFGTTGVNLNFYKLKFNVNAAYNGEIKYENLSPDHQNGKARFFPKDANGKPYSPSWVTLNAKISYQIIDKLQMVFGVDNITDQRYRPYSSGISAPGRNFILSVRGTI